jgi:hypothetical protein
MVARLRVLAYVAHLAVVEEPAVQVVLEQVLVAELESVARLAMEFSILCMLQVPQRNTSQPVAQVVAYLMRVQQVVKVALHFLRRELQIQVPVAAEVAAESTEVDHLLQAMAAQV